MHYPNIIKLPLNPLPVSFLEIDLDQNAERLQIFNRLNGNLISHKRTLGNKLIFFLPLKYSLESTLMCVMLDDSEEYNAAILDNVKPIMVNLVDFDPNNPQPYEPPP